MNPPAFSQIFRPGKPILDPEYLVGRDKQLKEITALLLSGGEAPVITGARGIGKTSLGKIASMSFGPVIETQCNIKSNFDNWARGLMKQVGIDTSLIERISENELGGVAGIKLGFTGSTAASKKLTEKRAGTFSSRIRPDLLYAELLQKKESMTILVDEFDRIPSYDRESIGLFADFLKLLANQSENHQLRLIFMGVGASARKLFSGHDSIKRNILSIHLKRLSQAAIGEFLLRASSKLKIAFSHDVVQSFQSDTMGFPHYLHLVGRNCVFEKVEGDTVYLTDYKKAVDTALDSLLGIDGRWDFIRNENTQAGDAILKHLIADPTAKFKIETILERLEQMRYRQTEVVEAMIELERKEVIRIPRDRHGRIVNNAKISIRDPEILPFLVANFRRERYVSSKQMDIEFLPKEAVNLADIDQGSE